MYFDVNQGEDGKVNNVPFNLYVEGSYFGDSEIFISEDRNTRDCTAIAETECQLLVITRKEIYDILRRFKKLTIEMREVAIERKKHHERAIRQVIEKYKQRVGNTLENMIMTSQG
jgi:CRP-like cAMP-binding protein